MTGVTQAVFMNQRSFQGPPGQQEYTTPGSYSWVAPTGTTKVSVVAIGGAQFPGGGLGYKNNISVTPGSSYTVVVGAGGASPGDSYFINTSTVAGFKGQSALGGSYAGDGGGAGGTVYSCYGGGGGGAGGYSGNGGNAGSGGTTNVNGCNGSGGGGGGGGGGGSNQVSGLFLYRSAGGGGGGTGIYGSGCSGSGGVKSTSGGAGGGGGSSGTSGNTGGASSPGSPGAGVAGGSFGGGAGRAGFSVQFFCFFGNCCPPPVTIYGSQSYGGGGAVRIIWPGCARSFPSTRTANE